MENCTSTPSLNQLNFSTCAFHNGSELLSYIIGNAPVVALNVREPKRAIYPSPVQSGEHLNLIEQHLAGILSARQCYRKDGSTFESTGHYALGAYPVKRNADGTFTTLSATLDVDGPDHDGARSQGDVDAAARNLCQILDNEGLHPFLARSHGGKGYHIWITFDSPVPAGFAKALGDAAVFASGITFEIEVFPKKTELEPGSLGSAIALPLNGRKVSEHGGEIIWPDGTPRTIDTIKCAAVADLSAHLAAYATYDAANARIETARAARKEFNKLLSAGCPDPNDFSDLGLELISKKFGEVTDEFVSEINVLKLNCPRHTSASRASLHVCPEAGWWKCHACGDKGAGETAEFSLAAWLMPAASNDQVLARLEQLRLEKNSGVPHVA